MIAPCVCNHEFQDRRYGALRRVHNRMKKAMNGPMRFKCTVCGRIEERKQDRGGAA